MRRMSLEVLADALTEINARWFAAERERISMMRSRGFAVPMPPCCLGCVEPSVQYELPASNQECQSWYTAPDVLRRGLASCLDAAAFDAGSARAKGRNAYVDLIPQTYDGGDLERVIDWHAVAVIDGKVVDSSKKLALPSVPARCAC